MTSAHESCQVKIIALINYAGNEIQGPKFLSSNADSPSYLVEIGGGNKISNHNLTFNFKIIHPSGIRPPEHELECMHARQISIPTYSYPPLLLLKKDLTSNIAWTLLRGSSSPIEDGIRTRSRFWRWWDA